MIPSGNGLDDHPESDLLSTPGEVAAMLGINTDALTMRVKRLGLTVWQTPGGHRRYWPEDINALIDADPRQQQERQEELQRERDLDMVRLYEQGWSIRQVAAKFDLSYSTARRILQRHTTLRL